MRAVALVALVAVALAGCGEEGGSGGRVAAGPSPTTTVAGPSTTAPDPATGPAPEVTDQSTPSPTGSPAHENVAPENVAPGSPAPGIGADTTPPPTSTPPVIMVDPAPVREGRVAIDATASGDPQTLLADLQGLGLTNGAVFGRIVSGMLPVAALDAARQLASAQFVRTAGGGTR